MEAVGVFGDVLGHAVAPAGDEDGGGLIGWGGLGVLLAVAKVYSIRYRGEAREWFGWSHYGFYAVCVWGIVLVLALLRNGGMFNSSSYMATEKKKAEISIRGERPDVEIGPGQIYRWEGFDLQNQSVPGRWVVGTIGISWANETVELLFRRL